MVIAAEPISATRFWESTVILIPARNEAACIANTIGVWRQLGAKHFRVVDNGSSDQTAALAAQAGAEVVFEPKRGYGAAAWRGLQKLPAEIQWILFSSADGSDRLTESQFNDWLRQIREGKDFVLGDRFSWPKSRRHLKAVQCFGNAVACALIRFGWQRRFNDIGSLRLIRRAMLEQLNLQDRGFGWNIEMQVRAVEQGLSITELPVEYDARQGGESKISGNVRGTIQASWGILWRLARLLGSNVLRRMPLPLSGPASF